MSAAYEALGIAQPETYEYKIQGKVFSFRKASIRNLQRLAPLSELVGKCLIVFNPQDDSLLRTIKRQEAWDKDTDDNGEDRIYVAGSETTHTAMSDSAMADRVQRRSKLMAEVVAEVLKPSTAELLADLIIDSLGEKKSLDAATFVKIDGTVFVEFVKGFLLANADIFGAESEKKLKKFLLDLPDEGPSKNEESESEEKQLKENEE